MANIPISALPYLNYTSYSPTDLYPVVNNSVTKNTTLLDLQTYILSGVSDTFITGYTYSNNTFTITDNVSTNFTATIDTMTGLTVTGSLSADTISATTYLNLPLNVGNTIYVDSVYGNNSTGEKYKFDKPYQTILAAVNAAAPGDNIIVRPGTYSSTSSLLKDGVNIHFEEGSVLNSVIATPFSDLGSQVVARITGKGVFNCSTYPNANQSFCRLSNSSSNLYFEFDQINDVSYDCFSIFAGTLQVKGRKIVETCQYVLLVQDGSNLPYFEVEEIIANSFLTPAGACIIFFLWCSDSTARTCKMNIKKYESNAVGTWSPIWMFFCNQSSRLEYNGDVTSTNSSTGNSYGIKLQGDGNLIYNGRIKTDRSQAIYIAGSSRANFVLRDSTVSSLNPATTRGIECQGANSYLLIDNSYISSNSNSVIEGFSNGNTQIYNSRIHNTKTGVTDTSCIRLTPPTTLSLSNVVMVAESSGTSYSILNSTTDTGPPFVFQSVKIYTVSSSNKILDSNITPSIGSFIYDTGITFFSNINE